MHEEKSHHPSEAGRRIVREFEEIERGTIKRWLQYARDLLGDSTSDDDTSTSAA